MQTRITRILQFVLALILLIFGTDKFFHFLPMPPMEAAATGFMDFLNETEYFFPIIAIVEISTGLLLLLNRWKGFALIILAPISVNIILFHLNYDLAGIGPGVLVFILNALLIYTNWNSFKTLFK